MLVSFCRLDFVCLSWVVMSSVEGWWFWISCCFFLGWGMALRVVSLMVIVPWFVCFSMREVVVLRLCICVRGIRSVLVVSQPCCLYMAWSVRA